MLAEQDTPSPQTNRAAVPGGAAAPDHSYHPFVLTPIIWSLIGGFSKYSIKERDLQHFVLALMLAYGGLPAAFVIDCCISVPLSILLAITKAQVE